MVTYGNPNSTRVFTEKTAGNQLVDPPSWSYLSFGPQIPLQKSAATSSKSLGTTLGDLESTWLVHELHCLCRSNEAGRRGWKRLAKGVTCYEKTRHSSIIMSNIELHYCGMMLSSAFPFLVVMIRHDIDITWYDSNIDFDRHDGSKQCHWTWNYSQ